MIEGEYRIVGGPVLMGNEAQATKLAAEVLSRLLDFGTEGSMLYVDFQDVGVIDYHYCQLLMLILARCGGKGPWSKSHLVYTGLSKSVLHAVGAVVDELGEAIMVVNSDEQLSSVGKAVREYLHDILSFLDVRPDSTVSEITSSLGNDSPLWSHRVSQVRRWGFVVESGVKRTSGRTAKTYRLFVPKKVKGWAFS